MKIKIILTSVVIALFLTIEMSGQQEAQFTQFMYNKMYYNPGYAGANDVSRIAILYRNQWLGFEGSPNAQQINFSGPFFSNRVGIGGIVARQEMGFSEQYNASLAYSYSVVKTEEGTVQLGFQGSWRYFRFNFADPDVVVTNPTDPSLGTGTTKENLFNFGVGLHVQYPKFYAGVSVPHILTNEIGLNQATNKTAEEVPHVYSMLGGLFDLSDNVNLQPNLLIKYVKNAPIDFDLNLMFEFNQRINAGLTYRTGGDDAGASIDLLTGFRITNALKVGVAYDYPLSELNKASGGSIEAMLSYDFGPDIEISNPRFF